MSNEELVLAIRQGDEGKLLELWNQVERFVAQQANRRMIQAYGFGGVTFEDLYQSGYLAMVAAVDSFDPEAGCSFIGWLALHLKTAFAEASGYHSKKQQLDPLHKAISLDSPIDDDMDGDTLCDLVADPVDQYEEAVLRMWREQLREQLDIQLADIPQEQAEILRRRFYKSEPLTSIAKGKNVCMEKARQWESQGLHELRKPKRINALRRFLNQEDIYSAGLRGTGISSFKNNGMSATERAAFAIIDGKL